jgi:hypothetical protein
MSPKIRPFFIFLIVPLWLIPLTAPAFTHGDCIKCHVRETREFHNSVHGREITCLDCHTGIRGKEHEHMKGSGAVDCGQCHEQENRHALSTKKNDLPQCHSCHTRHNILAKDEKASTVHPDRLKDTCKGCHPVECGERGYFSWLSYIQIRSHKKQDFGREYNRYNCIGCHQGRAVHGEKGPLTGQNCYICHMPLTDQGRVMGYIHPRADLKNQPAVFAASTLYPVFAVFLLGYVLRFIILRVLKKPSGQRR